MPPMEWMLLPYKRYADFSGRSSRMEFWMFVLFLVIVTLALVSAAVIVSPGGANHPGHGAGLVLFAALGIVLLVFMVRSGTPGPNRFGDDPLDRGLITVFS